MKKVLFAIIGLALMSSCSVKTNEEKARDLIEPQVKSTLIKPKSYEFGSIKLDSCFSDDSQYNPDMIAFALDVAKIWKDYKNYTSDAESAESSMTIYAPSYGYQTAHGEHQYKKYRAEMEKAQRKAADAKNKIIQMYKDNKQMFIDMQSRKHEFTGWAVFFAYCAETVGGTKTMGQNLFFLNKDMTEILYRLTEDDIDNFGVGSFEDVGYEFEEELKEIFQDKNQ